MSMCRMCVVHICDWLRPETDVRNIFWLCRLFLFVHLLIALSDDSAVSNSFIFNPANRWQFDKIIILLFSRSASFSTFAVTLMASDEKVKRRHGWEPRINTNVFMLFVMAAVVAGFLEGSKRVWFAQKSMSRQRKSNSSWYHRRYCDNICCYWQTNCIWLCFCLKPHIDMAHLHCFLILMNIALFSWFFCNVEQMGKWPSLVSGASTSEQFVVLLCIVTRELLGALRRSNLAPNKSFVRHLVTPSLCN